MQQTDTHLAIVVPELSLDLHSPGPFVWVRTQDSEQSFQDNVLHGASRWFAPDGKLLAEHWFWKGRRTGVSREFYASGKLYRVERFRDGQKHGVQEAYYESGQLKTQEVYEEGLLHGEVFLYWPSGKPKRKAEFVSGKRVTDAFWAE